MKIIVILTMLIISSVSLSKGNEKFGTKTMSFVTYELSQEKNIIDKLDYILRNYQVIYREETDKFVKIEIVVNDKVLHYSIYKNYLSYDYDLNKFLKDEFFEHITKSKLKSGYTKIELSPLISSSVYGKWCTIYGNNQIIKASGDSYNAAELNAEQFFNEIEKNKSSLIERIKNFDTNKLKEVVLSK